jgi:hypothetical protein
VTSLSDTPPLAILWCCKSEIVDEMAFWIKMYWNRLVIFRIRSFNIVSVSPSSILVNNFLRRHNSTLSCCFICISWQFMFCNWRRRLCRRKFCNTLFKCVYNLHEEIFCLIVSCYTCILKCSTTDYMDYLIITWTQALEPSSSVAKHKLPRDTNKTTRQRAIMTS